MSDPIAKIYIASKQLTHAQIITLRATPATVVEAPGSGLVIFPMFAYYGIDVRGGAYTDGGASPFLRLRLGSVTVEDGPFLPNFSGLALSYGNLPDDASADVLTANTSLTIANLGDVEFAGGHVSNTLSVRVWYVLTEAAPFTYLGKQ